MGQYNIAYRLFHIIIFIVIVLVYGLLVYFIIPDFVQDDKKAMASSYTGYAMTIAVSLLTFGSMVTEYIDKKMEMNSPPTIKGARR
jgi:uncharacterized membrane protein